MSFVIGICGSAVNFVRSILLDHYGTLVALTVCVSMLLIVIIAKCFGGLLPMGAKVMTYECGMRFLMDYLQGDRYFKIHRDGQNLDRARTQLTLVADMERKMQQMQDIVRKAAG